MEVKIPNQSECTLYLDDEKVYLSDSCGPCSACVILQQIGINIPIEEILATSIKNCWYVPYDRNGVCTSPENLHKIIEYYVSSREQNRKIIGMNIDLNESDSFSFIQKANEKYHIIFLTRLECKKNYSSHFVTLSSLEREDGFSYIKCIDTYSHLDEYGEWEVSPGEWLVPFSQFYKVWFSSPDGENGWMLLLEK